MALQFNLRTYVYGLCGAAWAYVPMGRWGQAVEEGLVPGHVVGFEGDRAVDAGTDDDVHTRDVCEDNPAG